MFILFFSFLIVGFSLPKTTQIKPKTYDSKLNLNKDKRKKNKEKKMNKRNPIFL